jgi:hypothetical protein
LIFRLFSVDLLSVWSEVRPVGFSSDRFRSSSETPFARHLDRRFGSLAFALGYLLKCPWVNQAFGSQVEPFFGSLPFAHSCLLKMA